VLKNVVILCFMAKQPVVAVVGHVDHGKSTLLDCIRKTNTTEKEAGGITQKIGAYEVGHKTSDGNERRITFIDTPGHEAFSCCRKNASCAADIAILVVAADEGAKPQTIEAYSILQKNKIPFVIALTKTDKPNADAERTKQSLAEKEIFVEGYGGNIPVATVSAKSGNGVSELLDLVLLLSDMNEKHGNKKSTAEGVVLEAHRSRTKGICATLIIKNGTLKKGHTLLAGSALSGLRIAEDFAGKPLTEATNGKVAHVCGWNELPSVGETFIAYENKKEAEEAARMFIEELKRPHVIKEKKEELEKLTVPLLVKADTFGSIEAIKHETERLGNEKVLIKIASAELGNVSENDMRLAESIKNSVVIGFNVEVDAPARKRSQQSGGREVHLFDIIYRLTEFLDEEIKKRTPKETKEEIAGQARIIKIFSETKQTQVVGGKVLAGTIALGNEFRIVRRGEHIGTGKIKELQKMKEKIREVAEGAEFGALAAHSIPLAISDIIEVVKTVEV